MPKKKNVREDAFADPEDPVAAYWAGFIAADGCIYYIGGKWPSLEVHVNYKDKPLLEQFKQWLNSEHSIYTHKTSIHLKICNSRLARDLLHHWSISDKKTFTLQPPNCSLHIVNHYIRGLFDGDGGWHICNNVRRHGDKVYRYLNPAAALTVNSHLQKWCEKHMPQHKIKPTSSKDIYRLEWRNRQSIQELGEYIYTRSTSQTRLDRKYQKWIEIQQLIHE